MALRDWLLGAISPAGGIASASGAGDAIWGKDASINKFETLRPEQLQMLMQLLEQLQPAQQKGMARLRDLLSPGGGEVGDAFSAPYMRQFNEQIVPQLSERFAGMGSHGSLSSSGFQQSLGQAGGRLAESLAAMRESLGQQALGMLPGFQQQAMQPAFGNYAQGESPGMIQQFLGGLGGAAGKGAGLAMFGGL